MTVAARLWVAGYLAGVLAVLIGHQPMLGLLNHLHITTGTLYPIRPTAPLHVPQIVSLCFWAGWWGVLFAWAQRRFPGNALYWLLALAFGAILPTLVGWYLVTPLKGLPVRGLAGNRAWVPIVLNGAWGLATAIVLRALVQGAPPRH
ncbi:MAG: hypothetical protein ABI920_09875 [Casimicrobiaceae bacterium]